MGDDSATPRRVSIRRRIGQLRSTLAGSSLRSTPADRLKTVTLGLATDQSGPNVIAGIFIGSMFTTLAGFTPWWYPTLPGSGWVVSVLIYALADEVKRKIEAEKNRLLDPESQYYGIE